jgi:hypothetical protein
MKFFLIILLFHLMVCKQNTNKPNPLLSFLIGAKTPYSPSIISVEPKIGNPAFSSPSTLGFLSVGASQFDATKVTIRGKNFVPSTTGNTVLFNEIPATVEKANDQELLVVVPPGASSGPLSVANNNGACNSFDKRSGPNCASQDFFVNCYLPYKGIYGAELNIPSGTNQEFTLSEAGTKAIRSDLLQTLGSDSAAANTIRIQCATIVRVFTFSQSCVPTEFAVNGNTFVVNPILNINTKFYTIQYFVSAGKGICTVRVN